MIVLNVGKMQADEKGLAEYRKDNLLWDLLDGMEVYIETYDEEDSVVRRMVIPIHDGQGGFHAQPIEMEWCDQILKRNYVPPREGVQAVVTAKPEGVHGATVYVDGVLDGAFAQGRGFWRRLKKEMKKRVRE